MATTRRRVKLTEEGRRALAVAVRAHNFQLGAPERTTDSLYAAVEAGVPIAHLVEATGIPRMTLLRRVGRGTR